MKRILSAKGIREKLKKLAKEIAKKEGIEDLVFIGIKRRGDILARRLAGLIKKEKKIEVGAIDITFYRDDLDLASPAPIVRGSEINFSLNDKVCIIVDDVIFTGRTIRAALQEILDYGRPKKIRLCVLVDREGRELPIQPDYWGIRIKSPSKGKMDVSIFLKEEDGKEGVFAKFEK